MDVVGGIDSNCHKNIDDISSNVTQVVSATTNNIIVIEEDSAEAENEYDALFHSKRFTKWRKNCPYLYKLLFYELFDYPSATIQWLPYEQPKLDGSNSTIYRLLTGTHAAEKNELALLNVDIPNMKYDPSKQPTKYFDEDSGDYGGFGVFPISGDIQPYVRICHYGDVNKARYMPQNSFLIATCSSENLVLLFDYGKQPTKPNVDGICRPQKVLQGHTDEGFALSWHPYQEGLLLTAAHDGTMRLWNFETSSPSTLNTVTPSSNLIECKSIIQPLETYHSDTNTIDDVQWHPRHAALFGTAASDGILLISDIRSSSGASKLIKQRLPSSSSDKPSPTIQFRVKAHQGDCNSFHPLNDYALLTGSDDQTILLWDMRCLNKPVSSFLHHNGSVLQLEWCPFKSSMFSSASADSHILVWDIEINNDDPTKSSSLIFDHAGHDEQVPDLNWHYSKPGMIASVCADSSIQIWIGDAVYRAINK
ncbi:unnamed protein product [Didymodactylos carnosus]|uniref:Histone-binding protein RBBP4-like N-terminal domain-containing protein n=1 Tax=Didymodactylos carnosus TaxID=1234261 RepID=A0A813QN69_9BILA|nr:unnamed protein product [Didymodactylos carnosus]CAF0779806.1 unnamed protein product [Didymodactylos carnosus]CAF3551965.1 unnamed protein product [Didymodactylos carnosus]CAF3561272.1 unnamed protein product [Didymodactylos carnosus]